MYHLGQTQLLDYWGVERISCRWRVPLDLFWGAYSGLPLPRRHPIITLVGSPLPGKHAR